MNRKKTLFADNVLYVFGKPWYSTPMKQGKLTQNKVHLKEHEYRTVKFFLDCGYDVELIPPSQIKGLRMPDIMLQGLPWEMKAPEGHGKRTLQNTLQNAAHQSANIIIDLRRCGLAQEEAIKELERHFRLFKRIRCLKIITKDERMLDYQT